MRFSYGERRKERRRTLLVRTPEAVAPLGWNLPVVRQDGAAPLPVQLHASTLLRHGNASRKAWAGCRGF